jgi:16S rRNA (cytosine1402-N4)-methyltransferase
MVLSRIMTEPTYHVSVFLAESLEYLAIKSDGRYLDATLGGGGHTEALLKILGTTGEVVALDRDGEAVERAVKKFSGEPRLKIHRTPFSRLGEIAIPNSLDGVLFDLGVSSRQLDARGRGFTFAPEAPLDMRMDDRESLDAAVWIQTTGEREMARAFRLNSDLEKPGKLAAALKVSLKERDLAHSTQRAGDSLDAHQTIDSNWLREQVLAALKPSPMDTARTLARVFQAIRMEVNGELEEIRQGLRFATEALKPGGRLVVLSYHSVEDRTVKETVGELEKDCLCPPQLPVCRCGGRNRRLRKVLRKPLVPSDIEIAQNPRARSAKLRALERV